jgi:hypothetical protein
MKTIDGLRSAIADSDEGRHRQGCETLFITHKFAYARMLDLLGRAGTSLPPDLDAKLRAMVVEERFGADWLELNAVNLLTRLDECAAELARHRPDIDRAIPDSSGGEMRGPNGVWRSVVSYNLGRCLVKVADVTSTTERLLRGSPYFPEVMGAASLLFDEIVACQHALDARFQ